MKKFLLLLLLIITLIVLGFLNLDEQKKCEQLTGADKARCHMIMVKGR